MGFSGRGLCGPIGDKDKIFVLLEDASRSRKMGLDSGRPSHSGKDGWVCEWASVDGHGWCKNIGEGAHKLSLQITGGS